MALMAPLAVMARTPTSRTPSDLAMGQSRHGTGVGPQQGFTLIELLVVFAIMALIVSVVPFAFGKMRDGAQYRDVLRSMVSEMRAARNEAQLTGVGTRFRVDLQKREYGTDGHPARPIPDAVQVQATVAGSELIPGQVAAILFLPDGGATGGSIDVLRSPGVGTRLRVDWMSGRVHAEALNP